MDGPEPKFLAGADIGLQIVDVDRIAGINPKLGDGVFVNGRIGLGGTGFVAENPVVKTPENGVVIHEVIDMKLVRV